MAAVFFTVVAGGVYWLVVRSETGVETDGGSADQDQAGAGEVAGDGGVVAFPDLDMLPVDLELTDPSGASSVTASAELRFDRQAGKVCYSIDAGQSSDPYESRIREGGEGENGAALVRLGPFTSPAIGCVDAASADTEAIRADPAGHYLDLVNPATGLVLRSQLSENTADLGTG